MLVLVTLSLENMLLKLIVRSMARINEYSCKHQLGILSGPVALLILSFDKALCTIISETSGKAGDASSGSLCNGHCKLYSFNGSKNIALILLA